MKLTPMAWQVATGAERREVLGPEECTDAILSADAPPPTTTGSVTWFWWPLFERLEQALDSPLPLPESARRNYRSLVESLWQVCLREGLLKPQVKMAVESMPELVIPLQNAWLSCLAPTLNGAYSHFLATEPQGDEEALKQRFMQSLWTGAFATNLKQSPMLLRLLATRLHFWQESLIELLNRLEADHPEINRVFFSGVDLGPLQSLAMSLSDAHGGGRGVAILTFAPGQHLVYKPKSLAVDAAIPTIAARLQSLGHPFPFHAIPVLDRGDYGWSAFIGDDPVAKANPEPALARKLGQLNALAHALGCTDLHPENFAVVNGHPTLWDLETFLRPHFAIGQRSERQHPSRRAMLAQYEDSIIGTGLIDDSLPAKNALMRMTTASWDEFIEGFRETYQWQVTHLAEFASVWESFSGQLRIRSVMLPTAQYAELLQASCQPAALRDGLTWSHFLSGIRSDADADNALEQWIRNAEETALARLDVPAFYLQKSILAEAHGNSRDLLASGDTFLTPLDHAREKWSQLGESDLALQLRLLRVQRDDSIKTVSRETHDWPATLPTVKSSDLTDLGLRFTDQILAAAEESHDAIQWWNRTVSRRGKVRLAPILASLYDGAAGVALLLGAAHRISGKSRYQAAARAALRPLLHDFRDDWRRPRAQSFLGIGGVAGYPSIHYACRQLMAWGGVDEADELAARLHALISPEEIARDTSFDVIGGSAGLILGLLSPDTSSVNPDTATKAQWAGEHLLRHCPAPTADWQPGQSSPLGGFSHGAAGFALAHHRLARVTGESRYANESERWVAYQESLLHPQTGHYRDLRVEADQQMDWNGNAMCSWCHGAAGIGLAYSEMGKTAEAQRTLQTMNAYPREEAHDFLCCGNVGRVACGYTVATRLGETEVAQTLRSRAYELLPHDAPWELSWKQGQNRDNVSFYQGLGGIAYTLLRLDHPEELPCILGLS